MRIVHAHTRMYLLSYSDKLWPPNLQTRGHSVPDWSGAGPDWLTALLEALIEVIACVVKILTILIKILTILCTCLGLPKPPVKCFNRPVTTPIAGRDIIPDSGLNKMLIKSVGFAQLTFSQM